MPTWGTMQAKKAWNAAAYAATAYIAAAGDDAPSKPFGWWAVGVVFTVAAFIATYNAPNQDEV